MRIFFRKTLAPRRVAGIALGSGVLICLFFVAPTLSTKLGNLFFGQVPLLYNVTLAQFFFKHATSPLFGNTPPLAYYQLSRTHFIQGALDQALAEAYKELELYPESTQTYYILGLTYGYIGEEPKAIEQFKKFAEHKPNSWAARNDLAWLQFRIGDIDGALETIQPVSHDIKNPWVQNTYGVLLMNKKRYMEAKGAFLHALKAANDMDETTWGRAYPGNDPRIYGTGLSAMRTSIKNNLESVEKNIP